MRKNYLLILTLLAFSLSVCANGVAIDGIYYLLNSETGKATVTYPNETVPVWNTAPSTYTGTINIPSEITYEEQTYTVTAIGEKAFCLCEDLTSIVIPESVISVGEDAFKGCSQLTSVFYEGNNTISPMAIDVL